MERRDIVLKTIEQLVPREWFPRPEGSSVWMTAYQMVRVANTDIPTGPRVFDLPGVRLVMVYGTVNYLDEKAATPRVTSEGDFVADARGIEAALPEGAYLLLLLPFDVAGAPGDEGSVRRTINETVALLAAFESRNIVYRRLFDNVLHLDGRQRSVIGGTVVNPFSMPAPNITDDRLRAVDQAMATLSMLVADSQARCRLSLRWYQASIYDMGVDAFLKSWIALETLAMPDTTNIRPINEHLAASYGLTIDATGGEFHVGRLYGLRGRIVHGGEQIRISGQLLDYIGAIYVDVLFHLLGVAPDQRARNLIRQGQFDPQRHLIAI